MSGGSIQTTSMLGSGGNPGFSVQGNIGITYGNIGYIGIMETKTIMGYIRGYIRFYRV